MEQLGHWDRAEKYVATDSQENFRKQPRGALMGFKVDSVEVEPDGRQGTAVIEVQAAANVGGVPLAMPRESQWRWVDGAWYLVVNATPPKRSLQEMLGSAAGKGPSHAEELKFKGHRDNLGYVGTDQVRVAHFPLTNVSDHVVTITSIVTGCPCLTVKSQKQEFKPGESGEVDIEFNPAGYERDYAQTIVLKTDPGNQTIYLAILAFVMPKGHTAPVRVPPPKAKPGS